MLKARDCESQEVCKSMQACVAHRGKNEYCSEWIMYQLRLWDVPNSVADHRDTVRRYVTIPSELEGPLARLHLTGIRANVVASQPSFRP